MKKYFFVCILLLIMSVFLGSRAKGIDASSLADCNVSNYGNMDQGMSISISFTCTESQTAYFGVCDSGPVLEDFLSIEFQEKVVAENVNENGMEVARIGAASVDAGENTAILKAVSGNGASTYSFAVSSDEKEVQDFLTADCGSDFAGFSELGNDKTCNGMVHVFTKDSAPSDGTLEFHILLGNEGARSDEQIIMTWKIVEGQQLNNASVNNIIGPRFARVWWNPVGTIDWYLLTSQYWQSGDSLADEYGVSCEGGQPSYHTSFSSAIPEDNVCFDLQNGCN